LASLTSQEEPSASSMLSEGNLVSTFYPVEERRDHLHLIGFIEPDLVGRLFIEMVNGNFPLRVFVSRLVYGFAKGGCCGSRDCCARRDRRLTRMSVGLTLNDGTLVAQNLDEQRDISFSGNGVGSWWFRVVKSWGIWKGFIWELLLRFRLHNG
jgi:hypothetical protein